MCDWNSDTHVMSRQGRRGGGEGEVNGCPDQRDPATLLAPFPTQQLPSYFTGVSLTLRYAL